MLQGLLPGLFGLYKIPRFCHDLIALMFFPMMATMSRKLGSFCFEGIFAQMRQKPKNSAQI
jgi:hypothetical protein